MNTTGNRFLVFDPRNVRRLVVSTILAFILLGSIPSRSDEDSTLTLFSPYPRSLDRATVSQLLSDAFIGRRWTVVSADEKRVIGQIDHRGINAILEMSIEQGRVVYLCRCTKVTKPAVGGSLDRNRKRQVKYEPRGWIDNLRTDFERLLVTTGAPSGAATTAGGGNDKAPIADRLSTLDDLLSKGLITQEEYDGKRAEILSDL